MASSIRHVSAKPLQVSLTSIAAHPSIWLVALVTAVAGMRLYFAVTHDTFLGIDGGAYLLGTFQFWGNGPEQIGLERAPLAPGFLLVPFLWLWGVTPLAFNLYTAIFSLTLIPCVYILAQRLVGRKWALVAAVAASLDWHQWTLFATGVVPILGFSGLCLALWAMIGASETTKPYINRYTLTLVAVIPFIALSSQTSAGLALLTLGAAWLVLKRPKEIAIFLLIGGLLALEIAWPWYSGVLPGGEKMATPGALLYWPSIGEHQWYQAPIALGIVGFAFWLRPPRPIVALCVVIVGHTLASLVYSNDEALMNFLFRSALWVTIPMWIVATYTVARWPLSSQVRHLLVGGTLALAAVGSIYVYHNQFQYSEHFSADVMAAADYLQTQDVTRIGTNGESRAYWLSAYTGLPVAWINSKPPAPAYQDMMQKAECDFGWMPNCATGYVSHWVIDKTIRQQVQALIARAPDPANPWGQITLSSPQYSLIWSQGSVEVYEWS